jgi:DNA-binding GntR family transcriptional regulator
MVSVYEPASESLCAADEHAAIVAALRDRDAGRAIALSRDHFEHVEGRLHFDRAATPRKRDLTAVFGPKRRS